MNDILPNEVITRFIFNRGNQYFSPANKIVRFKSFMPPPDLEDRSKYSPDLSVCRISVPSGSEVMPDDEIWKIGLELEKVQQPARTLRARADLPVSSIYDNNLKVIPDPQPCYKEHANINPFPPDRLGCQMLATELARVSEFVRLPEKI